MTRKEKDVRWAMAQRVGGTVGRLVLVSVAFNADARGVCRMTVKELAHECLASRATTFEKLAILERAGLVTRTPRYNATRGRMVSDIRLVRKP